MRWLWLVVVAACGRDPAPATTPLASDGTHLRDAEGRIAVLHGVNARIAGVFDVTFDDGRTALEPIPALTDDDCTRMRALGFDFLRLPINWSGIEPALGTYDEGYLANVDAAVQCAARAGMVVMIDLHQDAYSKEIGEDGAPLWAIQPPPTALLQGPLDDLGDRRTSAQVTAAFATFFDPADPAGVRARFLAVLDRVAARWADDPAVIGFELFNEPPVGDTQVTPFSIEAAARVRAAAPAKLVMFEPSATRNLFDFAPKPTAAFPIPDAVYAPHIYTFVFYSDQTQMEQLTPEALEPSVQSARAEAMAWRTPLLIGEYGVGPDQANADLWMGVQQQLHDRYLASDAFWVWKEDSQASWGLYDHASDGTWTERPRIVAWVSRIHAARIAGTVSANEYDYTTGALHLETHGGAVAHEVYIPERSAATFAVTCAGTPLAATRDPATGLVEVRCDGALDVTP
ncbi:MAG: cellulase family glycosylhydrolase [Kofleriaceae bacterium]